MLQDNKIFSLVEELEMLPLAFHKVDILEVIPHAVENKLKFYNKKYKAQKHQAVASKKPISKII